jgi:glycosyltransferase involved in cell wall biosynthesis
VNNPLVSIIIPTYNAADYILVTLKSIFEQTYRNWEIIIIDDGSTDQTSEKIATFLSSNNIFYFFQENQGVAAARNYGISKAKGELIAFLDADDYWMPENLAEKIKMFYKFPETDWVFSDMYESDGNLENLQIAPQGTDKDLMNSLLLWENEVIPGTSSNIILKKHCLDHLRFDVNTSTAADLDFTIRLAHLHKGTRIPLPLIIYRQMHSSMSRNIRTMERDCIYIYNKSKSLKLFYSYIFMQRCFSNMYLILAGSWWVNGGNKLRGGVFILRAVLNYPPIILKIVRKIF